MKKMLLVVGLLLVAFSAALAEEAAPVGPVAPAPGGPTQEGPRYTIFTKLGRGIGNMIMAPIEIPVTTFHVSADCDVSVGLTFGVLAGAAAGAERAVAGALDIVTFLFPPYDRPVITYELGKSPAAGAAISAFPKEF